jgi:hypothetical protein
MKDCRGEYASVVHGVPGHLLFEILECNLSVTFEFRIENLIGGATAWL